MAELASHNLQKTVDEITGYSRRTRRLVWGGVALTVLGLALGVVVAIQAVNAQNTSDALQRQAAALHASQLANCALSNSIKAKEVALWHTLVTLAAEGSTTPPTAQSRKITAEFLNDVDTTFIQLNCAKAYPGG